MTRPSPALSAVAAEPRAAARAQAAQVAGAARVACRGRGGRRGGRCCGGRRLHGRLGNPCWGRYAAIGQPDIVDGMLDAVQAGAGRKHPAIEDALDLALKRHLVDFDESIGVGRLGRRAGVANPRCHLQRAKLHRFADRRVERDDAAGDLVEPGEYRARILDLLCRHLGDDRIIRLRRRRGIRRLRRTTWLWNCTGGWRRAPRALGLVRRRRSQGAAGRRRQWLCLDARRRGSRGRRQSGLPLELRRRWLRRKRSAGDIGRRSWRPFAEK